MLIFSAETVIEMGINYSLVTKTEFGKQYNARLDVTFTVTRLVKEINKNFQILILAALLQIPKVL